MDHSVTLPDFDPCSRPELAVYCRRVRETVSPERFEHVLRVARLAEAIAVANGFAPDERVATCLAALLHDVARDLSPDELWRLAPPENVVEQHHPLSVHGRAGCAIVRSWGVDDPRVLEAIEGHVFGAAPEQRVAVAVYVADVCEPGRGVNDDIRVLAMHDLGAAYEQAVAAKVRYLHSRGKAVHPATLRVYEQIAHRP